MTKLPIENVYLWGILSPTGGQKWVLPFHEVDKYDNYTKGTEA